MFSLRLLVLHRLSDSENVGAVRALRCFATVAGGAARIARRARLMGMVDSIPPDHSPRPNGPPHGEQPPIDEFSKAEYEALRREIDAHTEAVRESETYAVAAAGIVYAWLFTAGAGKAPQAAWFIPAFITFFAGLRCLAIALHVEDVAGYIQLLEKAYPSPPNSGTRYEGFLRRNPSRWIRRPPKEWPLYGILSGVFWVTLFAVTTTVPFIVRHVPRP